MQILQPLLNNNQIPQYKPMTWYNTAYLGFSKEICIRWPAQMVPTNMGEGHNLVMILLTQKHIRHFIMLNSCPFLTPCLTSLPHFVWLSDIKRVYFPWKKTHVHTVFDRPHPFLLNNMILQAITSPMDSALLNSFAFFSHKWN